MALRGGSHSPQSVVIDAYKDWGGGLHMDVKGVINDIIEQVRITYESGYYHIEAYFDRQIINSGFLYLHSIEGPDCGFSLNSGVLPAGAGAVSRETGDIQSNTFFENDLVIDGTVRSEEIKVEVVNGADYVFEEGYDLQPLNEIHDYIKVNKHLPEVPSADEMVEDGISIGEMNILLLKKIEELTLHLIALKEEFETLKANKNEK